MTLQSTPVSRRRWLLVLLPALLIGGFYGGKAIVRAHVDGVIAANVGEPLPAFALRDEEGVEWTQQRLLGRPAVLHFFRSHCPSCEQEAAEMRRFEQELPPDAATVLHVVTDTVLDVDAATTAATIAQKGYARPVLRADAAFMDAFHSVSWSHVTPVTYVARADGTVAAALRGRQTAAALREALAAAR